MVSALSLEPSPPTTLYFLHAAPHAPGSPQSNSLHPITSSASPVPSATSQQGCGTLALTPAISWEHHSCLKYRV